MDTTGSRRIHRSVVAVLVLLALSAVGCTGDGGDATAGQSTASATPEAAGATSSEGAEEEIISSVTVEEGDDITSEVEVRVAKIISEYEGTETDAGTLLTVPTRVLFDFDEATLRPDAQETLDEIVEVLDFYEDAPVEVVGHTDACGSEAYNQDLSERRASAVAEFLAGAGIDGTRLTAEGRGESEPVVEDDDEECREQANRRVEVLIRGVAPPDVDQ